MKIQKLIVKNIGLLEDVNLELNKPLILFYGEIRQGKTTILNAVRWAFGGSFPADILRHGQTEAEITLVLDNGSITRTFYLARDGKTTKARPVVFVRDGRPVLNPVDEIKRLLNPFLLDQEHLRNMSESERKRYFVELFATSAETAIFESQAAKAESEAREMRAKLSGFGEIDTTPVEAPDLKAIEVSKQDARNLHSRKQADALEKRDALLRQYGEAKAIVEAQRKAIVDTHAENSRRTKTNAEFAQNNANRAAIVASIANEDKKIADAQKQIDYWNSVIETARSGLRSLNAALDITPFLQALELVNQEPLPPLPAAPDTSALDAVLASQPNLAEINTRVAAAAAQAVKHEQYLKNLERAKEKSALAAALAAKENELRQIRAQRVASLKVATGVVPGMAFDEAGEFTYEGTAAGMLSTSQVMKLSEQLSGLYPEGFDLSLIDRAESLGKSVFALVDRAKAEDKTILATIVGEAPADAPEEVGVFIVEAGKVK